MTARLYTVHADGISLTLDLEVGHIRSLEIDYSGRRLHPFHTAPWIEDKAIIDDPDIPAGLKFLSGDFFCAQVLLGDIAPFSICRGFCARRLRFFVRLFGRLCHGRGRCDCGGLFRRRYD